MIVTKFYKQYFLLKCIGKTICEFWMIFFLKIFFYFTYSIHRITSFPFENVSRGYYRWTKKLCRYYIFRFFRKEKHIKIKRQTNFPIFPYYNFNVVKKNERKLKKKIKKKLYKINCTQKSLRTETVSLLASCNISTLFWYNKRYELNSFLFIRGKFLCSILLLYIFFNLSKTVFYTLIFNDGIYIS